MAIDPNIPLMARGIDLGQALTTGLQSVQSIMATQQMMEERERQKRLQPIKDQILALQQQEAVDKLSARNDYFLSLEAKPFIGVSEKDTDWKGLSSAINKSKYADENTKTALAQAVADKDFGTFANLYNSAQERGRVFGYTPSKQFEVDRKIQLLQNYGLAEGEEGKKLIAQAITGQNPGAQEQLLNNLMSLPEKDRQKALFVLGRLPTVTVGGVPMQATGQFADTGQPVYAPPSAAGLGSTRAEIANALAQEEAQKDLLAIENKSLLADAEKAKNATEELQKRLEIIQKLKVAPGREAATGFERNFPGTFQKPGSNAQDYISKFNQFKSQEFSTAVSVMKGFGSLSNAEGERLDSMLNALSLDTSDVNFLNELNLLEQQTNALMKAAEEDLRLRKLEISERKSVVGQPQKPPEVPPAPGYGEIVDLEQPIEGSAKKGSKRGEDEPPEGLEPMVWQYLTPQEKALWRK